MSPLPPESTLFPYTTLFRSHRGRHPLRVAADVEARAPLEPRPELGALLVHPVLHVDPLRPDRKSTRLNSSHVEISYAVFCLKKKKWLSSCNVKSTSLGANCP